MNYWMKFMNIVCIIINSIGLFVSTMLHNYSLAGLSGLFVVLAATNLLHEEKKDDENQTSI